MAARASRQRQRRLPPRAFGYARVSTDMQAESGLGLDEQQRKIEGRAIENGWQLEKIFVDAGVSGSVPLAGRPAGDKLLRVVRPGDVVVVAKLDRMFRSARDALNVIGDFQRRGIGLWLLDIGECSGNGVSQLVITIMSAVADFERGRISERIKDAKLAARRDNRYLGGTAPFGYRIGADGKLVPNPKQQAAIARMRRLRRNGKSLMAIRDAVRKSGVPISHETVRLVLQRPEPAPASIKWPPGVVDRTSERSGETLAIIGTPRP